MTYAVNKHHHRPPAKLIRRQHSHIRPWACKSFVNHLSASFFVSDSALHVRTVKAVRCVSFLAALRHNGKKPIDPIYASVTKRSRFLWKVIRFRLGHELGHECGAPMNDGISMPESHSIWDLSSLTKDGTMPSAVKAWCSFLVNSSQTPGIMGYRPRCRHKSSPLSNVSTGPGT